jgi:hypothetical protein
MKTSLWRTIALWLDSSAVALPASGTARRRPVSRTAAAWRANLEHNRGGVLEVRQVDAAAT